MGNDYGLAEASLPDNPAELRKLYAAVQQQRTSDAERLRNATREREYLNAVISELDGTIAELKAKVREQEVARGEPTVLRLTSSSRVKPGGLFAQLMGALLLRLARRFARAERFVEAEALYQAVAVFKPRPFLVKQVGNMLYRQDLYLAALDVLQEVEEHFDGDREVSFLITASEAAVEQAK